MNLKAHQLVCLIAMLGAFALGLLCCKLVYGEPPPRQTGPLGVAPTAREIELGRALFFDPRISANGSVSCATCHDPARGWSDGLPVAVGIFGQLGTRNSPTVLNAGFLKGFTFWDGRAVEAIDQALLPMSNRVEMGAQTEAQVVARLRLMPEYVGQFAEAYGIDQTSGSPITGVRLARAIAAFESTIVSVDNPVNRFRNGERGALSADARVGYELFVSSRCIECHKPPLFTDGLVHNNGSEFATRGRINDRGRAAVSNIATDTAAFKTPTLAEIGRTSPYMHNGQMPDLARVVRHYNTGGYISLGNNARPVRDSRIDQRIQPLGLSAVQEGYLIRFLEESFRGSDYPSIGPSLTASR